MSNTAGGDSQFNVDTIGGAALAIQSVRHSADAALTDVEAERLRTVEDFLASYTDDIGGGNDE